MKVLSRLILVACIAASLVGCAGTSHVMLGHARAPISPAEVQIYLRPPQARYEEIARLDTSSGGSFSFTAQSKTDAVLSRLKVEAAKLGANGVLLEGISDRSSGSIGTGGGSEGYSRSGAMGAGLGVNLDMSKKVGGGLAIYVEPH